MKRLISIICVLSVLVLLPSLCMADSSVTINELGFSVSLPENVYVLTQNTDSSSSVWDVINVEPSVFIEHFKSNNIYLNAIAPDFSYEIVIIGRQSKDYQAIFDLSLYKDDEIFELLSSSTSGEAEKLGFIMETESVYNTGNLKFFNFSGIQTVGNQTVYIDSYCTIKNGQFVQVNFRSYWQFSSEQQEINKSVINSIHFNRILEKPEYSIMNENSILYKSLVGAASSLLVAIPVGLIKIVRRFCSLGG